MAGEILKKKREDLGFSVEEIAEALKVRKDYLAAIEEDAFEKLPVPVYTLGYIRAYARHLDIDSDPIVAFYNQHLSQPESATIIPIAFSRKKRPGIYVVIALLASLAAGIALFLFLNHGSENETALNTSRQPVQQQAGAAGVDKPNPRVIAAKTKEHNLQVTAEETTWLAIKFSNGKADEALLRPGDAKTWAFSGEATLKIGNAGGIGITFDGKDLGTPGNPGEIRTLTLPENAEKAPTSP